MATLYSPQNRADMVRTTAARIPALRALGQDPWARGVLVISALTQAAWNDELRRGAWLSRHGRRLRLDEDWLMPFRAIAESLSAGVSYNPASKTVTMIRDGHEVKLKLASKTV